MNKPLKLLELDYGYVPYKIGYRMSMVNMDYLKHEQYRRYIDMSEKDIHFSLLRVTGQKMFLSRL